MKHTIAHLSRDQYLAMYLYFDIGYNFIYFKKCATIRIFLSE